MLLENALAQDNFLGLYAEVTSHSNIYFSF